LILFLTIKTKIIVPTWIFSHLIESIKECNKGKRKTVPYERFLSELFHQSRLIKNLHDYRASLELDIEFGKVFSYVALVNMKIQKSDEVQESNIPFSVRERNPDFVSDYLVISLMDNVASL